MMAMAPHRWYVQPILALYITLGVGCYCFIRTKAMREARHLDKVNRVPTPLLYTLMAFSGELWSMKNNMKKFFFMAILPLAFGIAVLSSCSKDVNNVILEDFDYPEDVLFGTWEAVMLDGESWPSRYPTTTATFYENGTYSGKGAYGTGSGTYTASGKTIKCYVGGDLYCKYDVLELSGSRAKMRMSKGSKKYDLVCKKRV